MTFESSHETVPVVLKQVEAFLNNAPLVSQMNVVKVDDKGKTALVPSASVLDYFHRPPCLKFFSFVRFLRHFERIEKKNKSFVSDSDTDANSLQNEDPDIVDADNFSDISSNASEHNFLQRIGNTLLPFQPSHPSYYSFCLRRRKQFHERAIRFSGKRLSDVWKLSESFDIKDLDERERYAVSVLGCFVPWIRDETNADNNASDGYGFLQHNENWWDALCRIGMPRYGQTWKRTKKRAGRDYAIHDDDIAILDNIQSLQVGFTAQKKFDRELKRTTSDAEADALGENNSSDNDDSDANDNSDERSTHIYSDEEENESDIENSEDAPEMNNSFALPNLKSNAICKHLINNNLLPTDPDLHLQGTFSADIAKQAKRWYRRVHAQVPDKAPPADDEEPFVSNCSSMEVVQWIRHGFQGLSPHFKDSAQSSGGRLSLLAIMKKYTLDSEQQRVFLYISCAIIRKILRRLEAANDDSLPLLATLKPLKAFVNTVLGSKQLIYFVTGAAGSGKSEIIAAVDFFVQQLDDYSSTFRKCAASNIAGARIGGGTGHKMFRLAGTEAGGTIPCKITDDNILDFAKVGVIVIDEVSMCNRKLLGLFESQTRRLTCNPDKIWGGIDIVFMGDLFQLPGIPSVFPFQLPTSTTSEISKHMGGYRAWKAINTVTTLRGNHRFKDDPEFGELLLRIRQGIPTDQDLAVLQRQCHNSSRLSAIPTHSEVKFATKNNRDRVLLNRAVFENKAKHLYEFNPTLAARQALNGMFLRILATITPKATTRIRKSDMAKMRMLSDQDLKTGMSVLEIYRHSPNVLTATADGAVDPVSASAHVLKVHYDFYYVFSSLHNYNVPRFFH